MGQYGAENFNYVSQKNDVNTKIPKDLNKKLAQQPKKHIVTKTQKKQKEENDKKLKESKEKNEKKYNEEKAAKGNSLAQTGSSSQMMQPVPPQYMQMPMMAPPQQMMPQMAQWGQIAQPVYLQTGAQLNGLPRDTLEPRFFEKGHYEGQKHINEDPTSVPEPLVSTTGYMTSTQAKYVANETSDIAKEPKGHFGPYLHNAADPDPKLTMPQQSENVQLQANINSASQMSQLQQSPGHIVIEKTQ